MLIVCGESFSYGTDKSSWPTIVADKLEMPLLNLSVVGCGNFAICHQLQYVIDNNLNPEFVVISLTAAERFEFDEDELGPAATIEDFKSNIDEVSTSTFSKKPTITSGNVASQIRNVNVEFIKPYLMSTSFRLAAQNQAWAINYLTSKLQCKYLLYRNIFPRYHDDTSKYKDEYYYGLNNLINSGPYDYESELVNTTNHLSLEDNVRFSRRVLDDLLND